MNDDGSAALDQVRFLARAESRVRIMGVLTGAESMTQAQLRERVDASRTTVSRALGALVETGWAEHADGGYRLTSAGRHVAVAFDRLRTTVARVDELAEFLRWFPAGVETPGVLDATDVSVYYATDAAPYAPARRQSEILATAARLRILLPAVDGESTETLVEQVLDRGLEVETIVTPAVESVLESDAFAPQVRRMVDAGGFHLQVADDGVPFYLGLADGGTVQIGLADEDGLPRALLETTDDDIYEWAARRYGDVRADAEPKYTGDS